MTKLTSINQTGGIIAEEVRIYDNDAIVEKIIENNKQERINQAIATIKSEGYVVISPEEWNSLLNRIDKFRKDYNDHIITGVIVNGIRIILEGVK